MNSRADKFHPALRNGWLYFQPPAAILQMEFIAQFKRRTVAFDALANQTSAGQKISVTRLDFLASEIALRRADGVWIGRKNWFAYISVRDGKNKFSFGKYSLRNLRTRAISHRP